MILLPVMVLWLDSPSKYKVPCSEHAYVYDISSTGYGITVPVLRSIEDSAEYRKYCDSLQSGFDVQLPRTVKRGRVSSDYKICVVDSVSLKPFAKIFVPANPSRGQIRGSRKFVAWVYSKFIHRDTIRSKAKKIYR